ncbi:Uncharacterised protein [Mycobacterium tuberculosis]|nr:Uncharacterised protein [Mycobacterium tuberculosis]
MLDLAAQTADVGVADVRHLFQHQVFYLGFGDAFEGIAGFGVDQQRVAGAQLARPGVIVEGLREAVWQVLGDQGISQPNNAFLVGVADDQSPMTVGQDLAQGGYLADRLECAGLHDGQGLVEPDRLPLLQRCSVNIR